MVFQKNYVFWMPALFTQKGIALFNNFSYWTCSTAILLNPAGFGLFHKSNFFLTREPEKILDHSLQAEYIEFAVSFN
jgi:hypothetical protein